VTYESRIVGDAVTMCCCQVHFMSRDIQYIGMDLHKEAIVIAVLNGSGMARSPPVGT
jgi:hypothetical protein